MITAARAARTTESAQTSAPAPRTAGAAHGRHPTNRVWARFATSPPGAQAKLSVSSSVDPAEREADEVADQVMRMPAGTVQRMCAACSAADAEEGGPHVEHRCPECEENAQRQEDGTAPDDTLAVVEAMDRDVQRQADEEIEEETVQRAPSGDGGPAMSTSTESGIRGLRHGGRPLSGPDRSFFEPRFGRDFSHVRLHTDADAARTSASIRARAFTYGPHIAFGAGEYQPGSDTGRRLLAHELTHTIQQGHDHRPRIQRKKLESPYRARVKALYDASGNERAVLTCNDVNAVTCIPDVLSPGMEVTVTHEMVGGAWLFVEKLPEAAVTALFGQTWIHVPGEFLEKVPDASSSAAPPATATKAPTSHFLDPNFTDVNELGIVYQPSGANLRDTPLPKGQGSIVLEHLGQNTKVYILKHDPKEKWYAVSVVDGKGAGRFGYVADWLIWRKLPEPEAQVLKIESGQKPIEIAKAYYKGKGFTKWGKDPRYLVNALVYINDRADHNGVGPPGIKKPKGDVTKDWAEAETTAGVYIWIPSAALMRQIYQTVVEKGGGTGSITADLWNTAKKVLDKMAYGAAFVGGLIHGFFKSIYDAIAGLLGMVKDILVSVFTGEVIKDAKELWDSISKLTWDQIKEAFGNWAHEWEMKLLSDSPWVSGHAHGFLTGYIMAEAAQLLISGGTIAAAKAAIWSSRIGKIIKASKAYTTLAKGVTKAGQASDKARKAMTATSKALKATRVFKSLDAARDWVWKALDISAEFVKDLSLDAINKIASLGDDLVAQMKKLSEPAKRILCGCASPCNPVPAKIRKAFERLKTMGKITVGKQLSTGAFTNLNPVLMRMVRMKRALVGTSLDAFKKYNVAVGRFVVNGTDEVYVTAVNTGNLLHSEEKLLGKLEELRKIHGRDNVKLDELFTERIPCVGTSGKNASNCRGKLATESPGTKVFFALSDDTAGTLGSTKAKELMRAWGLTPP